VGFELGWGRITSFLWFYTHGGLILIVGKTMEVQQEHDPWWDQEHLHHFQGWEGVSIISDEGLRTKRILRDNE
jgi:hypothetical protein